jgi:hypothetical protein
MKISARAGKKASKAQKTWESIGSSTAAVFTARRKGSTAKPKIIPIREHERPKMKYKF